MKQKNEGAILCGRKDRTQDPALSDDSTRILLSYWRELPPSRRFEFLMKLAEVKEAAKKES